jgi:hypothetical protein
MLWRVGEVPHILDKVGVVPEGGEVVMDVVMVDLQPV